MKKCRSLTLLILCLYSLQSASAHHIVDEESHPHHKPTNKTSTAADPWHLLELALTPAYAFVTNVRTYFNGAYRVIESNGIPNHPTGEFPNSENPNTIQEQSYLFRMLKEPKYADRTTWLFLEPFGVAVNGVPFDPGANEFWNRDRNSGWQYEPMFNRSLGIDQNNAHVQPNGAYHYHGLPTGLLQRLAQAPKPVLIGYAADGFPIYAPFGYKHATNPASGMTKLRSSYRLKGGSRPSGPGGHYDGSFVQDYEYVAGLGDLDDCNGRVGITSEYPKGTYYYVVTDGFPFIPRGWKGAPDETFQRHGHRERPGQQSNRRLQGRPGEIDDGPPNGGPNGFPRGGPGNQNGFPRGGPNGFPPDRPPGGPNGFPPDRPPGGPNGSQDRPPGRNGFPPGGPNGFPPDRPPGDPNGFPPDRSGGPNGRPPGEQDGFPPDRRGGPSGRRPGGTDGFSQDRPPGGPNGFPPDRPPGAP